MHVAIVLATYRRTQLLAQCLRSLAGLEVGESIECTIIVVDNDGAGSAKPVVQCARQQERWPIVYEVEPERNISLARNRGVALALSSDAEFVAFLDDDETAEPNWIGELLRAQHEHSADIVWGPAIPLYPATIPPWIVRGGFFKSYRNWKTGTTFGLAYTSNVLVSAGVLRSLQVPFDPAFGLGGGGDVDLFRRLSEKGARIVWAAEARVDDHVHLSRASASWILRRAFRTGNAEGLMVRRDPPRRVATYALIAALRMSAAMALVVPAALFGRVPSMHMLCRGVNAFGRLRGIGGYRYIEYSVVHGT